MAQSSHHWFHDSSKTIKYKYIPSIIKAGAVHLHVPIPQKYIIERIDILDTRAT